MGQVPNILTWVQCPRALTAHPNQRAARTRIPTIKRLPASEGSARTCVPAQPPTAWPCTCPCHATLRQQRAHHATAARAGRARARCLAHWTKQRAAAGVILDAIVAEIEAVGDDVVNHHGLAVTAHLDERVHCARDVVARKEEAESGSRGSHRQSHKQPCWPWGEGRAATGAQRIRILYQQQVACQRSTPCSMEHGGCRWPPAACTGHITRVGCKEGQHFGCNPRLPRQPHRQAWCSRCRMCHCCSGGWSVEKMSA